MGVGWGRGGGGGDRSGKRLTRHQVCTTTGHNRSVCVYAAKSSHRTCNSSKKMLKRRPENVFTECWVKFEPSTLFVSVERSRWMWSSCKIKHLRYEFIALLFPAPAFYSSACLTITITPQHYATLKTYLTLLLNPVNRSNNAAWWIMEQQYK